MSVSTREVREGEVVITVHGRFDVSLHREFRQAYTGHQTQTPVQKYLIDLNDVDYIDSSALGMLLQLRKFTEEKAAIEIIGCNTYVREIFRVANFDSLFTIR